MEIAELPDDVRARLAEFLPAAAALGNPIDMIATASAADTGGRSSTLTDADACDAVITIFVPSLVTTPVDVATANSRVRGANPTVPIAAAFMVSDGVPAELCSDRVRVPGSRVP